MFNEFIGHWHNLLVDFVDSIVLMSFSLIIIYCKRMNKRNKVYNNNENYIYTQHLTKTKIGRWVCIRLLFWIEVGTRVRYSIEKRERERESSIVAQPKNLMKKYFLLHPSADDFSIETEMLKFYGQWSTIVNIFFFFHSLIRAIGYTESVS